MSGTLSVIIDGVGVVGGVWKLRTTSYNSIIGITSSLALIRRLTGGPLAGIPLHLTLSPKTGIAPDGKTVLIYVVGVEYRGMPDELQEIGYQRALKLAQHSARIEQIEDHARSLLRALPGMELDGDDPDDVVSEFYPEQAQAATRASPEAGALAEPKARRRKPAEDPPETLPSGQVAAGDALSSQNGGVGSASLSGVNGQSDHGDRGGQSDDGGGQPDDDGQPQDIF